MPTVALAEKQEAFAIWITGLPASGKSTLTEALRKELAGRGVDVAVLESDELRKVFSPHPSYDDEERNTFYSQMIYVGTLLAQHGVPVIFDATANRRVWRDQARRSIPAFVEVFVDTPLELCMARDPKGIYRAAQTGGNAFVPGLQTEYEPPVNPEITIQSGSESPDVAAGRIVQTLIQEGFLKSDC